MRHRAIVALLVWAVSGAACSSDNSPVAPTTVFVPTALLDLQGDLVVSNCFPAGIDLTCSFEGEIVNLGSGCATDVRGITRSFVDDVELGRAAWLVLFDVRPDETVLYDGTGLLVPPTGIEWTFDTELFWTDVVC